jgi:hypothetical protein
MDMKRTALKPFKFGFLTFLVLISGYIWIGCSGDVNFSTASLSDAVICKSVDSTTMKSLDKTDVFSQDTAEIFCSVKLSNAPEDTQIVGEWIYVGGEVEGLSDHKIADYSLKADGTKYLSFSLSRPDNGFPKGDYVCKLYLSGKEKLTVPFKVQ